MATPDTMFERYGGVQFVTRLVLNFYDRVLDSVRLAPFFANTRMERLVEHQATFISSVMGRPASYANATLRAAHAHQHIDVPKAVLAPLGVYEERHTFTDRTTSQGVWQSRRRAPR